MKAKKGFYLDGKPCKFAALSKLRNGPVAQLVRAVDS